MSNIARKHHYIPQFYLRGFLDFNLKKEQFHVLDKIERRYFVTTPRNVGSETDFNRVNVPGKPIDEAEKLFAEIEGKVARVIKGIEENLTLPQKTDMEVLIYFVALLYMRNPQIRNNLANIETTVIKQIFRCLTSNRERYESQMQRVLPIDQQMPKYEEVKQFVEDEDFDIMFGHGHHLRYELEIIDNTVLPLLVQRKWVLLIAEDDVSDFVCSDRPVALISIGDPPENPNHPYNIGVPGLGMQNTELTVPLNRRMALAAAFENHTCVATVDEKVVAEINARTIHFAAKHIYCSNLDFKFLDNGVMKSGRDFIDE